MKAPATGMIVTGMIQTASFLVLCVEAEVVTVGRGALKQHCRGRPFMGPRQRVPDAAAGSPRWERSA